MMSTRSSLLTCYSEKTAHVRCNVAATRWDTVAMLQCPPISSKHNTQTALAASLSAYDIPHYGVHRYVFLASVSEHCLCRSDGFMPSFKSEHRTYVLWQLATQTSIRPVLRLHIYQCCICVLSLKTSAPLHCIYHMLSCQLHISHPLGSCLLLCYLHLTLWVKSLHTLFLIAKPLWFTEHFFIWSFDQWNGG